MSRRRASNEERSGELPCLGLFLVTGRPGGEVVSRAAIEMVHPAVEAASVDDLGAGEMIAPQCRDEVRLMMSPRRPGRSEDERPGPGPSGVQVTFAGVLLAPGAAYIVCAGDMHIYRFRGGKLEARTREDAELDGGALDGFSSPDAPAVLGQHASAATRALGCDAAVEMTAQVENTEPGDIFLACSGGLWPGGPSTGRGWAAFFGGERRGAKGGEAIFPGARPAPERAEAAANPAVAAGYPGRGWSGEQSPLDC
ncbi:PP2C family protein-serine/threonine phosphatase [Sorangium sp. So ce363]|uniref:PP2C family protein-serine/threonine phosphatase n=1 Tax=Sorangium sp. So ce363 TaxID=3133304 RepID=UPI003F60868E